MTIRHRALRQDFLEHRGNDRRLQRGNHVPAFDAPATAGNVIRVGQSIGNSRQIVIFLTSTCPFCRQTLPAWKEIVDRLKSDSGAAGSVVALTTDSFAVAAEYARANALPFPLVPSPDLRMASLYRAFVVPQTFVVDSGGRVLYVRHRAITTTETIDSVLAAALPIRPPVEP